MRKIIVVLVILAGMTALVYGIRYHYEHCLECFHLQSINAQTVRHFIQSFGPWGIAVFVALYTANTFSPFLPPIAFLSLAAGAVFGPILGTIALTLGTFCGTTAAFFAARYIARSWIEGLLKGKGADLDVKLSQNGFFILLPMRLIGFPPYGIIDFICGLSKMRYVDFAAATMLGAVPWIIAQVLLADRITVFASQFVWNDLSTWYDPVLLGLIAAFATMIFVTGKIVKSKEKKESLDNA